MNRRTSHAFLKLSACVALVVGVIPLHSHAFAIRSLRANSRTYVYLVDVGRYYGMTVSRRRDTVILKSKTQRVEVDVGSRECLVNGTRVHLSFAVADEKGVLLVSERDLTVLLDPLLRDWALPIRPIARIVLDPGHGGEDDGARGKASIEKEINLAISLRVKALLEARGYRVMLTRQSNTETLSLAERGERCRRFSGDLFVSIHANKTSSRKVTGIETFIVPPVSTPSTTSSRLVGTASPGNRCDALNARLAYEIHRHLMQTVSTEDRGLKHARFQVLREAQCPAVLVETGFLSNSVEERRLRDARYQQQLAIGIVNGILSYHRAQLVAARARASH